MSFRITGRRVSFCNWFAWLPQVSWHWKYLTELDQLWMLKCLRFGWYINFSPTPFEQGIWKKHYIEMVKELNITRPKVRLSRWRQLGLNFPLP